MAAKPRIKAPKKAKKGEVVTLKTLYKHKMEPGTRKGKDGKLIPRMIVNNFKVSFNGKEFMNVDMHPAMSANPYFLFHFRAEESGEFEFVWTDDKGEVVSAKKKMEVA